MFSDIPSKVDRWDKKLLLVESRIGWPFPLAINTLEPLKHNKNAFLVRDRDLMAAIENALGVDGKYQDYVFD